MTKAKHWNQALFVLCISLLAGSAVSAAIGVGTAQYQGIPVVWICAAIAFLIQWLAFIPAAVWKTERFYDLTGSITYMLLVFTALFLTEPDGWRSLLAAAFVVVWAARLGFFLFSRILQDGSDKRFDQVRGNMSKFFVGWTLQGLWIVLTLPAALVLITSQSQRDFGFLDGLGISFWLLGFSIEVIADRQKRVFRKNPANQGLFIQSGLWKYSRHPNYLGEIIIWLGMAVLASSIFAAWQWAAWISPLFVTFLLTRVSGVPLLEEAADKKWGGRKDYESYKTRTPVLVPRLSLGKS